MIGRIVVAVLLCVQLVPAFAAKEKDDEVEYLLPQDWESQPAAKPAEKSLSLTPKAFQSGMTLHVKEIPQCSSATLTPGKLVKNGTVVYQQLKSKGAEVDIILHLNPSGTIASAQFVAPQSAKDNAQLSAMMCSTYAIMRTLQPDLETKAAAQANMKHSWASAAQKPFVKAFYFNTIKTQLVPLEMNVY